MCERKTIFAAWVVLCLCTPSLLLATADMRGGNHRVILGVFPALHVGQRMANYDTTVFGSIGQIGTGSVSGGGYSITAGVISSLQPAALSLDNAYAYPNPYRPSKGHSKITFTKLTTAASIKIYTVSGELVRTVEKDSTNDAISWDVLNESGQKIASGLYIYIITSGSMSKSGKLIVIK